MCGIALLFLTTNAMGPCSIRRRWNFLGQSLGLGNDICIVGVTKNVCDRWPSEQVKEWSPNVWLLISALLMVCSGAALLYTAFWLSGTGYSSPKKKKNFFLRVTTSLDEGIDVQEGEVTESNGAGGSEMDPLLHPDPEIGRSHVYKPQVRTSSIPPPPGPP